MRLGDNRVCPGWFAVEQGLREECMLAVLTNVVYTRFKAGIDIMDDLVYLSEEEKNGGAGGSNQRRASPGNISLGHALR